MMKKRSKKVPRQLLPKGIQRDYYRYLKAQVKQLNNLIRRDLMSQMEHIVNMAGIRQDALLDYTNEVATLIEGISVSYFTTQRTLEWERVTEGVANQTDKFNWKQVSKQYKHIVGVDPFISEPYLNSFHAAFRKENVSLITKMTKDELVSVGDIVLREVRAGSRHESINKLLVKQFGITENKAALIARDQVLKFNGDLTKVRQENLGIDKYIWRGTMDSRERASHRAREGQTFKWSDPPDGGHPGHDIQCRCTAEPVFDDLLK